MQKIKNLLDNRKPPALLNSKSKVKFFGGSSLIRLKKKARSKLVKLYIKLNSKTTKLSILLITPNHNRIFNSKSGGSKRINFKKFNSLTLGHFLKN